LDRFSLRGGLRGINDSEDGRCGSNAERNRNYGN
jgi:hypothetical protein